MKCRNFFFMEFLTFAPYSGFREPEIVIPMEYTSYLLNETH